MHRTIAGPALLASVPLLLLGQACGSDDPSSPVSTDTAEVDASPSPPPSSDGGVDSATSVDVTLGGTVVGLGADVGDAGLGDSGTGGLVLANGSDEVEIFANGPFAFPTKLTPGSSFDVTVASQPSNPTHTCTVSGGSGKAGTSDITTVTVNCDPTTFTAGGTVKGKRDGTTLVLTSGSGADVSITSNGSFAFPSGFASGTPLAIAVKTNPGTQKCFVDGGSFVVAGANASGVVVTCYDEVAVTGTGNPAVVDFQVPLTLTTATFDYARANANGDDLRFFATHGGAEIPYYIESWDPAGDSVVWVKVPSVGADATSTLLFFAGEAALGAGSSGDKTFLFFDDFSGADIDSTKWEVQGTPSTLTVTGGLLTFKGASNWEYARSKTSFTSGVIEADLKTTGVSAALVLGYTGSDDRFTFRDSGGKTGTTSDPDVSGGNGWFDQTWPATPRGTDGTLRRERISASVDGSDHIVVDEYCNVTAAACATARTLDAYSGTEFFVGFSTYSASYTVEMDRIFVRQKAAGTFSAQID